MAFKFKFDIQKSYTHTQSVSVILTLSFIIVIRDRCKFDRWRNQGLRNRDLRNVHCQDPVKVNFLVIDARLCPFRIIWRINWISGCLRFRHNVTGSEFPKNHLMRESYICIRDTISRKRFLKLFKIVFFFYYLFFFIKLKLIRVLSDINDIDIDEYQREI